MPGPDLSSVDEAARATFDDKFRVREQGLANSRKVIRASANAIRAIHRDELERARELIRQATEVLDETIAVTSTHPDIRYAGFVNDAAKELAEAHLTLAFATRAEIPGPDDLGIDAAPYLHGMGETVGELRRRMLDKLRAGDLHKAEELLDAMSEIYDLLAGLDYPDGMTGGLRRTTDVARSLIERSRGDLTSALVQERLRRELAEHAGSD